MFAVLTEQKNNWQPQDGQTDQYWELTDDPALAAEAKDVVFDIFDHEGLMCVVSERHPAPVGCTMVESCGGNRVMVRGTAITKSDASDEDIFAAARELGSVQIYYNSEFNKTHRSNRAVMVVGDFIFNGCMLTYDPKKAKSILKAQGTKGSKALVNGDPHIDLLKGVRDSLWRMVKEHFMVKYWNMNGAMSGSTNSKSDVCRAIMVNVRMLKAMNRGRPEWRKAQNFNDQFGPNIEPLDAIKALIPYAAGLRKRGESREPILVDKKQWNADLRREKVMVDVAIENRWFKRVALFLEKEERFLADNPDA